MLREAGKEVVLSTQVLIESGADVATLHKHHRQRRFMVEANDMGAVHCLAGKARAVCGRAAPQHLQPAHLQWMAALGATLGDAAGNGP
jgi:hypothetical protein